MPVIKLIYDDFRTREVSVLWLCVLAMMTTGIPLFTDGWVEVLHRSILNLLVVLYMSVGVMLWSWVKARKVVSPIDRCIGLGDLLFFLILVPLFPFRQYVWLLPGCCLFSLVWWGAAIVLSSRVPRNVPFVATSGVVVAGAIIYKVFFE